MSNRQRAGGSHPGLWDFYRSISWASWGSEHAPILCEAAEPIHTTAQLAARLRPSLLQHHHRLTAERQRVLAAHDAGRVTPEELRRRTASISRQTAALEDLMKLKSTERIAARAGHHYRSFDRRRIAGSGKWRHIDAPVGRLRLTQKHIHAALLKGFPFPPTMLGGVPGRSVIENARLHAHKPTVLTLDLKNCFGRIRHERVYETLQERLRCSASVASLLTKLTTFHGHLPQGAPTSPLTANLVLLPLYQEISDLCHDHGLTVSFWIDDVAISGSGAQYVIEPVVRLIHKHGHAISREKLRIMHRGGEQLVTGVYVNSGLSVGWSRLRECAEEIRILAAQAEISEYALESIRGKISFVRSVNEAEAAALRRLADRHLPKVGVGGDGPPSYENRRCQCRRRRGRR